MFDALFEPFSILDQVVPNRLVMPPMVVGYAGPRGEVTEQLLSYYEARARAGVGLVIVEASYIREDGKLVLGELGIYSDDLIPGLTRLADLIKASGALASIQIAHGGIQAKVEEPVGPSPIGRTLVPPTRTPRELATCEVEKLVEDFASAALRAKLAGFNMVEVHGTHGYIITQFLSPLTNKRSDKYGADRALFAIEVVKRIKEKCGRSYPVIFRLNADELQVGGITLEYAKYTAKRLVEEAGVDAFDVTGGNYDTMDTILLPYFYSTNEGWFFKYAEEVRRATNVPVISGGLITDPRVAEEAVKKGSVDAVFIGRQLIADPDWPKKVREGRLEEIRPCQACNEGCVGGRLFKGQPVWCSVNPLVGFEYRWPSEQHLPKAQKKRKVLIIGGGPSGLEAARTLSLRGHEVILAEEREKLGGTLTVACTPHFKKRLSKLIAWYEDQLVKLGVKVLKGIRATPDLIKEISPDVVIISTGSRPQALRVPGAEQALIADDVLVGKSKVGQRVIVVGGGLVGVELALYLASTGKEVTIVEALPEIAIDIEPVSRMSLIRPGGLLEKHKVKVLTSTIVIGIEKGGVEVLQPPQRRFLIEGDAVVLAVGREPNIDQELVKTSREVGKEVYIIGDAKEPRKIIDAVHEAFFTALRI
ncbi:MAG: FAD-dependent oxidoreductase [Desulfurococcaceae archaeon]